MASENMGVRELHVPGAFELTPVQHGDERGVFLEWLRQDVLADAIGHAMPLAQANCSVSAKGVLRGIHFAQAPPSQAKYVTCVRGAVVDVVVDIRDGSPTFGAWDLVQLDDVDRRAVYIAEGLGHAFLALTDGATLMYLCSEGFNPDLEHGVDALDPDLAIGWPVGITPIRSAKDSAAPRVDAARDAGLLPSYEACLRLHQ